MIWGSQGERSVRPVPQQSSNSSSRLLSYSAPAHISDAVLHISLSACLSYVDTAPVAFLTLSQGRIVILEVACVCLIEAQVSWATSTSLQRICDGWQTSVTTTAPSNACHIYLWALADNTWNGLASKIVWLLKLCTQLYSLQEKETMSDWWDFIL